LDYLIKDEMSETFSTHEGNERLSLFWVGKAQKNRLFGNLRRRWKDNIKIDFRDTGCEGVG